MLHGMLHSTVTQGKRRLCVTFCMLQSYEQPFLCNILCNTEKHAVTGVSEDLLQCYTIFYNIIKLKNIKEIHVIILCTRICMEKVRNIVTFGLKRKIPRDAYTTGSFIAITNTKGSDNIVLAAELGFEPRQTESESVVLPLHNSAILVCG